MCGSFWQHGRKYVVSSRASAGRNRREGINWGGLWASEEDRALKVSRNHSGFKTWRGTFVLCSSCELFCFWNIAATAWCSLLSCCKGSKGKCERKGKLGAMLVNQIWTQSTGAPKWEDVILFRIEVCNKYFIKCLRKWQHQIEVWALFRLIERETCMDFLNWAVFSFNLGSH